MVEMLREGSVFWNLSAQARGGEAAFDLIADDVKLKKQAVTSKTPLGRR